MKVLNLYAGGGGNRKLWENVEVTAVEVDPDIAKVYQEFFPDDKVIVDDAHQYLLDHYKKYDFIWSSPPCPTHSVTNHFLNPQGVVRYPDMSLWQEIIFLKTWAFGKWVVENVKSYYDPLYTPYELERHYFWANFYITPFNTNRKFNIANARTTTRLENEEYDHSLEQYHGFKIPDWFQNKRLILRNMVYPPLGKHVLDCALGSTQKTLVESIDSISKRSGECG